MALPKTSNYLIVLLVDQSAVTRLGMGCLLISISIMVIRSEVKIETHSAYGASSGSRQLVMLVNVSGALFKSFTICNVASQQTRFQIDNK